MTKTCDYPKIAVMSQPALISTREATELLGLTNVSTISRWVKEGRLTPAMKLPGQTGAMLFRRDEIEAKARELAEAKAEAVS